MQTYSFWVRLLGGLCALAIGLNLIWRGFKTEYQKDRRHSCQSNLKNIMLSVQQYKMDNDTRLPVAGTSQKGWEQSFLLYDYMLRTEGDIYQCPSTPNRKQQTIDYWFNAQAFKKANKEFAHPTRTVLAGDGQDDAASNASLAQLPSHWLSNEESPLWRHLKGANYAFADGHVKWYQTSVAATWAKQTDAPTFAVADKSIKQN